MIEVGNYYGFCSAPLIFQNRQRWQTQTQTQFQSQIHRQKRLVVDDSFFSECHNLRCFLIIIIATAAAAEHRAIKILRCYSVYYLRYCWGDSILRERARSSAHTRARARLLACLLSTLSSTCQNNNQPYNVNRSPILDGQAFFPLTSRFVSLHSVGLWSNISISVSLSPSVSACICFGSFCVCFFLEKCSSHIIIKI